MCGLGLWIMTRMIGSRGLGTGSPGSPSMRALAGSWANRGSGARAGARFPRCRCDLYRMLGSGGRVGLGYVNKSEGFRSRIGPGSIKVRVGVTATRTQNVVASPGDSARFWYSLRCGLLPQVVCQSSSIRTNLEESTR